MCRVDDEEREERRGELELELELGLTADAGEQHTAAHSSTPQTHLVSHLAAASVKRLGYAGFSLFEACSKRTEQQRMCSPYQWVENGARSFERPRASLNLFAVTLGPLPHPTAHPKGSGYGF